jgi:hypothetical protein
MGALCLCIPILGGLLQLYIHDTVIRIQLKLVSSATKNKLHDGGLQHGVPRWTTI